MLDRFKFFIALASVASLVLGLSQPVSAKLDKGFIEKTSREVWAAEPPMFNPKADLSDTIFNGESAVFIAIAHTLAADYYNDRDMSKYAELGVSRANAIDARFLRHYMVKLNDSKAVEEFGDFEFDHKESSSMGLYNYVTSRYAFGARIHKPDGTVENVDISEAFAIESGKKNKTNGYKIAIPGLEPGCVLEYYYLTDMHIDEFDMNPITIPLFQEYPVKNYIIECKTSEALTTEYRSFNGAPDLLFNSKDNGSYNLGIGVTNLEKRPKLKFTSRNRQMPFYKFRIKNNLSKMRRYYPSSRQIGIYANVANDKIINDGAYWLAWQNVPEPVMRKANSLVRNWRKANPEATEDELIDAALMASRYAVMNTDERVGPATISALFVDLLHKLKVSVPSSIGLASGLYDIPLEVLTAPEDASLLAAVGGRTVFTGISDLYLVPGEIPHGFGGEDALFYAGKRESYPTTNTANRKIPASRPKDNTTMRTFVLTCTPDDSEVTAVSFSAKATGASKNSHWFVANSDEMTAAYEKFLAVKEGNLSKPKLSDTKVKENRKRMVELLFDDYSDLDVADFENFKLISSGLTPAEPATEYSFDFKAHNLIEPDGDGLSLNLGRLFSDKITLTESDRAPRDFALILPQVAIDRTNILINIPEGYEIDDEEIEALSANVSTTAGSFFSEAKINENGQLSITVQDRIPHNVLPSDKLPELVKLIDASQAFTNSTVMLRKK